MVDTAPAGSGALLEKEKKQKDKKQKDAWDAGLALAQLANSALMSSSSLKELGQNALQAVPGFLNQLGQAMMPGPGGLLFGGLLGFGANMLLNKDDKLPVNDNAVDVRLVAIRSGVEFVAVRDRSERSMSAGFRQRWSGAAARG